MCHGNHDNSELRDSIRLAGIRGLQGVIRKTVSDDLTANIWDKQHMEKIVPSLLFNMQNMVSSKFELVAWIANDLGREFLILSCFFPLLFIAFNIFKGIHTDYIDGRYLIIATSSRRVRTS